MYYWRSIITNNSWFGLIGEDEITLSDSILLGTDAEIIRLTEL